MATLTRPKQLARPTTSPLLTSGVPSPFPREQLAQLQAPVDVVVQEADAQAGPSRVAEVEGSTDAGSHGVLQEVMPSIVHVQKSCLITLNNLLSVPTGWNPIVPDRRHSMPSSPPPIGTSFHGSIESSTSALQILVANLRARDGMDDMIQISGGNADGELLNELRLRTDAISSTLEPADALLATSIVSLLSHFQRLSTIQSIPTRTLSDTAASSLHDVAGPSDPFALLRRQLSDLQVERLSSQPDILVPGAPPVLLVEAALLWNKIDEELEAVVAMCKEHTENLPRLQADTMSLPPEYDPEFDYEDYQHDPLPQYDGQGVRTSIDSKSHHTPHSPTISARQMDEKMRLDLEGVAMAIDRLYLVAPQLHNQRVELKSSKLAQMEKARREGSHTPQSRSGKQKEKDDDIQELERMWELLGKASERSLVDQSVVLEGGLPARLEKARQKDLANKHAFVEQLASHSSSGRLHGQDAVLQPRMKDPNALLTLPEFMREAVPASVIRADPQALLTLPEFVKEPPPAPLEDTDSEMPRMTPHKYKKSLRHRSLSAPSLAWLRSSSPKSGSSSSNISCTSHSRSRSRGTNGASASPPNAGFEVHYVAENHENLQHVLVFFTVTGALSGVDIEAEVLPPFPESHSEGGDRLIISSGPRNSLPLILPARILPGKQEVRVQSTHYEVKLTTVSPRLSSESPIEDPPPLLDAAQLSLAKPSCFICASCSLVLVQATKISEYRDLPSEHWQELVDAWMCHSDQKLHDHLMKHGKGGFWPEPNQALVGGSYILFEESSMALRNLHLAEETKHGEDWRLARCLCGAILGRSQNHSVDDGTRNVFRLLKFAVRPVSLNMEPTKIPLSAFIVEDMTEFVRAHATYRFVILDEEDELPRILVSLAALHLFLVANPALLQVWLFKPSIRLAYTTPAPYAMPKSASIHAAKVLFKILTPFERTSDLKS
ncbi:hypothetical protein H0H87_010766 [Tephrocybe sp. NHM501043]|nr:hypothetical protein H0H87_010766 [Tephrocybe sp. NHM501043]